MSTIEITRVEDVRAGDVAIVKNGDTTVTGSVRAVGRAWDATWLTMQHLPNEIPIPHWTFVSATREVPDLPTEPGSVITDVVATTLRHPASKYQIGICREGENWDLYRHGGVLRGVLSEDITAWTPARIVPEDGAS